MSTQSISNEAISEKAKEEAGPRKDSEASQLQSQAARGPNSQKAKQEIVAKMEDPEPVTAEDCFLCPKSGIESDGRSTTPSKRCLSSSSTTIYEGYGKILLFIELVYEHFSSIEDGSRNTTADSVFVSRNLRLYIVLIGAANRIGSFGAQLAVGSFSTSKRFFKKSSQNSWTMRTLSQWRTPKPSADCAKNIIAAVEIFASANEKAQAGNIPESLHVALPPTTAQITQSRKASAAHAAPQAHIGLKTLREIVLNGRSGMRTLSYCKRL